MLTDCAEHPEARCVTTQATHSVGTFLRHVTLSTILWLRGPTAHKRVFDEPQTSAAPRSDLESLAL